MSENRPAPGRRPSRTAIHEAGHIFAAWLVGLELGPRGVRIGGSIKAALAATSDGHCDIPNIPPGHYQPGDNGARVRAIGQLVVNLAGAAAEARYRQRPFRPRFRNGRPVEIRAAPGRGATVSNLPPGFEPADAADAEAARQALAILQAVTPGFDAVRWLSDGPIVHDVNAMFRTPAAWDAVSALAQALEERGTLHARDVAAILGDRFGFGAGLEVVLEGGAG